MKITTLERMLFMKPSKAVIAIILVAALIATMCACSKNSNSNSTTTSASSSAEEIETALKLANNENQEWTYDSNADAWILSVVTAVMNPARL